MLHNSPLSPHPSSTFVSRPAIILMRADATILNAADWGHHRFLSSYSNVLRASKKPGHDNPSNVHGLLWKKSIFPHRRSYLCVCSILVLFREVYGLICTRHILSPFALIQDLWNTRSNHIASLLLLRSFCLTSLLSQHNSALQIT